MLLIYVDDIVITSNKEVLINDLKNICTPYFV